MDIKGRLAATAVKLVGRLPLHWSRRLGRLFGHLSLLRGDSLRVARINLEICYPHMDPARRERLARESLLHTAATGCEAASIWRQPWHRSAARIQGLRNGELLDAARREGRGLLVLMPHLGNWEIFGMYLGTLGPSTGLYAPSKVPALDPIIRGGRQATGIRMVPTNVQGVRGLLKALKAGDTVMVLPDQEPDMGGDLAPFFGRPALTMTLAHSLLQRTGCRCLFGFARRVKGGFELVFLPAPEAIYSGDQQESLAALNRGVEACVAEAPAQYQWRYKRFRKLPRGRSRIYDQHAT